MPRTIEINREDYIKIENSVDFRWSQTKKGSPWAEGLNKNGTFIGLLGEMAVGKVLNLKPNLEYHEKGVKDDFIYKGYSIEVKTSSLNYQKGLLKIKEGGINGYNHKLKSDIYIFCTLRKNNPIEKTALIDIQGIISKHKIIENNYELKKAISKKSNHYNIEIPYNDLTDINNIFLINFKK